MFFPFKVEIKLHHLRRGFRKTSFPVTWIEDDFKKCIKKYPYTNGRSLIFVLYLLKVKRVHSRAHTEPRLAMCCVLKYLAPDCTALDRSWQPWLVLFNCIVTSNDWRSTQTSLIGWCVLPRSTFCEKLNSTPNDDEVQVALQCISTCSNSCKSLATGVFFMETKMFGWIIESCSIWWCVVCWTCGLGRSSSWCLSLSLSFSSCSCCSLIWLLPPMTAGFWGLEGSWVPCFTGALWVIRCWFRAICKKTQRRKHLHCWTLFLL